MRHRVPGSYSRPKYGPSSCRSCVFMIGLHRQLVGAHRLSGGAAAASRAALPQRLLGSRHVRRHQGLFFCGKRAMLYLCGRLLPLPCLPLLFNKLPAPASSPPVPPCVHLQHRIYRERLRSGDVHERLLRPGRVRLPPGSSSINQSIFFDQD